MKGQHITKNQVNIRIGDAQKQNTWVGNDDNERGQTIRDAGSKQGEEGRAGVEDTQGRGEIRATAEAREEQEAS